MGRIRRNDTHLPKRLFLRHGGYYYSNWIDGKNAWIALGRDESYAVAQANKLNLMKRRERLQVNGALRSVCTSLKQTIFERDGFRCVYCGTEKDLGVDHLIPYIAGGSSLPFNIVTSCADCNFTKGSGDPRDFILELMGFREKTLEWVLDKLHKSD